MLDLAGSFLFGGGFCNSNESRPFGEDLYTTLQNPTSEQDEKLWEFIHAVQARSLEDVVAKEPDEFVRCWMALTSVVFEPRVELDTTCRLRDNVDLCWEPVAIGTFFEHCNAHVLHTLSCPYN